jgi:hypothetical protein
LAVGSDGLTEFEDEFERLAVGQTRGSQDDDERRDCVGAADRLGR